MNINRILLVFLGSLLVFSGCKEESRIDYIDDSMPAPAQVSNVEIVETPGGAIVTYDLPDDPNLAYVKAIYDIRPGITREAKASLYTDTLKLVGYGNTDPHQVSIFTVGKNEKMSEPLTRSFTPLTPPIKETYEALEVVETFGGVQIRFENESKADLSIVLMADTAGTGTMEPVYTLYTAAPEGVFAVRGFDTLETEFQAFVRDRWNNKSDTLSRVLKPIYEQEIPKSTWAAVHLPTDTWKPAESYHLHHLWNNNIVGYAGTIFASTNSSILPQWFTIDLGVSAAISRIVVHQSEPGGHFYKGSGPKRWEIYGSNNPANDGSWESWTLMGTFESFKPSGLPMGQENDEDKQYGWTNGEDCTFIERQPPYRYLRFKTLETYGSSGQVVMAELDVWGQLAE
ncbi:uncharacterized protein DUF4959 [Anseongella ginsenosidimutans]|uniref:Uncharacterized protein DUF4959 n=1 Tax=Anseongella ginsenosidimutans TaxID=496056 RepID=A0A4R3KXK0_9SPHI|nr:DUF5000 domain-containing lipoprotein [Anseongella ginsenosidimutans]TCS90188.1 uncharacterized protein DUF4959 [Anseongella ginsenosidimutans]